MSRFRTYRAVQLRMFLLGTVPLLTLAGILGAAPNASATWSWGWQYASWGSGTTSVSDTFKSFSGTSEDDKEDGYCVSVEMGIRNSKNVVWGAAGVAGSVNCGKKVKKSYSGKPADFDSRYPYVCNLELLRGSNDEISVGYLTLWRAAGFEPGECSLYSS